MSIGDEEQRAKKVSSGGAGDFENAARVVSMAEVVEEGENMVPSIGLREGEGCGPV